MRKPEAETDVSGWPLTAHAGTYFLERHSGGMLTALRILRATVHTDTSLFQNVCKAVEETQHPPTIQEIKQKIDSYNSREKHCLGMKLVSRACPSLSNIFSVPSPQEQRPPCSLFSSVQAQLSVASGTQRNGIGFRTDSRYKLCSIHSLATLAKV